MGDLIGKQQAQVGEMAFEGQQNALNRALQWATYANDFERNNWVDQNKFDLERAGIDTERYKADLQYRGQVESANASANASRYGDDRRYQLGLVGADVDRERNLLNNGLQWSQLGIDWAKFLYSVSPDAFLAKLTPFGGNTYVNP